MLQSVLKSDSRFGVVRWDPIEKKMADIGCCAEIIKHQTSQDGRSNIVTIGQQRFRILEIINEAPFIKENGAPFLEIHHLKRLADGGSDTISNTVAICPNCHREKGLMNKIQQ